MTDKQRNLLLYLNHKCREQGINMRADDDDLLGKDWYENYKNITFDYTIEVIDKMKTALGMEITKKKRGSKK